MKKKFKIDHKGRAPIKKNDIIIDNRTDFIQKRERWLYEDTPESKRFWQAMKEVKNGLVVRKKIPSIEDLEQDEEI